MQVIMAKILDKTHLELSQSLIGYPGELIQISIIDKAVHGEEEENRLWLEATKKRFLAFYADEDSVYDNISW